VALHAGDFHTYSVAAFSPRELAVWRHGVWRAEWHYGRFGWWYDVGGVWYPYAAPVFPYPQQVAQLTVYDQPVVESPSLAAAIGPATLGAPGSETASTGPGGPSPAAPGPGGTATFGGSSPGSTSPAATTQASAGSSIPPLPAPPVGQYRCDGADAPLGFYPDIQACQVQWVLVPEASVTPASVQN